jgi:hypothetical protein
MKKIILTVAFALSFATAALAAPDVMASRYGNTTVVTDSMGMVTKLWYSPDHTFTGTQGDMALKGTWKVDKGTICLTYDTPPKMGSGTVPNPECVPVKARKVGDTWSDGDGANKITITVIKGH